ncbi:hypothetical protein [Maricaulis maris]|uniref:hypothetical protein n=1 Tax=Maricaulis maris TaxID=74318 RepID=UPI003B8DC92D
MQQHVQKIMRVTVGLVGAAAGTALGFFLILLLFALIEEMSGHRMMPRGAGWLFAIVFCGIAGWKVARYCYARLASSNRLGNLQLADFSWNTRRGRITLVAFIVYTAAFTLYVRSTEPFGWRMYAEDWFVLIAWFTGVPLAFLGSYLVYLWIMSAEKDRQDDN